MTQVDHAPWWRAVAQAVLLIIQLVGLFGALICAVVATGDYGAVLAPGLDRLGDPKDSLPDSPVGLWAIGVPMAILIYVWFLPVIGFILALVRPRSVRWALFWAAMTVLVFSPYGSQLRYWLLD